MTRELGQIVPAASGSSGGMRRLAFCIPDDSTEEHQQDAAVPTTPAANGSSEEAPTAPGLSGPRRIREIKVPAGRGGPLERRLHWPASGVHEFAAAVVVRGGGHSSSVTRNSSAFAGNPRRGPAHPLPPCFAPASAAAPCRRAAHTPRGSAPHDRSVLPCLHSHNSSHAHALRHTRARCNLG